MPFRYSLKALIVNVLIIFAISGSVGFIFGQPLLFLLITSVALLFIQYRYISILQNWLWQSKNLSPPQADGVWGSIFDGLDRIVKRYRRKQKGLNEKVRRFRDGAEALPDAALLLGHDLTIQWGNKKAQYLIGVRWPGDIGQRIDNLLRAPEFTEYLEKGRFDEPCLLNSPINLDLQLEIRLMDYGKEQILLLARDISRVHRIEEMRRDFVANVSHELKTPLTVVRGYVEMVQLTEHALDPHWQSAFDTIESQVSRMDRLVEQLLVLSRVEINDDIESMHRLPLAKLIKTLLKDADWLNQEKQHEIIADLDESIEILGIDTEIKSAFSNLISNAVAYTPANGTIELSLKYNGNNVVFSVKDNGPGIKPEDINRLTERFYRADKSRSRNTGGSGLGLAIVKHVLNHHGAHLVINSQWQQGSEFSIVFDGQAALSFEK